MNIMYHSTINLLIKQKYDSFFDWAETHSEYKVRMTRSTHIYQQDWTEGLGHPFALQDSVMLVLGSSFLLFCHGLLFVQLHLTSRAVMKDSLYWHTGKHFADVTCYSQLVRYLPQVGGYGLHVVSQLEALGQNDLSSTLVDTLEWWKVSLEWSPCRPTMVLVIPFHRNGSDGHGTVLVKILSSSPSHESWPLTHWCEFWSQWPWQCGAVHQSWPPFSHLKGVAVFHESALPLWCNNFMVMSPHVPATVIILFNWASVQMLPLFCLQDALTLLQYFLWAVCVDTSSVSEHMIQSPEAVSKLESATFFLDELESNEAWSPVLHELPAAVPSSGSVMALVGLEGGLVGFHLHCSELGPAFSTSLCVFLSPHSKNGCPMGECHQRGDLVREVWWEEEFQLDEQDCWKALDQVVPLAQVQLWWLGHLCPVMWWMPMHHPCSKKGCWRKCTKAIPLLNRPNWSLKKPLGKWCVLLEPFLPASTHVFSPAWSADLHIYEPASESSHTAHIIAELLPG